VKRYGKLALWGGVLAWMGLIFFLSAESDPGALSRFDFEGADKLAHIILYAVLGLLLWRASRFAGGRLLGAQPTLWTYIMGTVYGLSDEWHQKFVPQREADVMDLLADCIGIGLGIMAAVVYQRAKARARTGENR
jgi:VanZ family protein